MVLNLMSALALCGCSVTLFGLHGYFYCFQLYTKFLCSVLQILKNASALRSMAMPIVNI